MNFINISFIFFVFIGMILVSVFKEIKIIYLIGLVPSFVLSLHFLEMLKYSEYKNSPNSFHEKAFLVIITTWLSWLSVSLYIFSLLENKLKYGSIYFVKESEIEKAEKVFNLIIFEINQYLENNNFFLIRAEKNDEGKKLSKEEIDSLIKAYYFIDSKIEYLKTKTSYSKFEEYKTKLEKMKDEIMDILERYPSYYFNRLG